MTPSLEGLPTKAKEAPSPHKVRLSPVDINPVSQCLGGIVFRASISMSQHQPSVSMFPYVLNLFCITSLIKCSLLSTKIRALGMRVNKFLVPLFIRHNKVIFGSLGNSKHILYWGHFFSKQSLNIYYTDVLFITIVC